MRGVVGGRDSKNSTGPALVFAPDEWDVFMVGVVAGSSIGRNPPPCTGGSGWAQLGRY
ncbi:DUF397 domain-containing protein [Nocardia sp. NPDC004573]